MIDQLPAEIIEQILSHLPTVFSIVSFASTNKRIYQIYSDNDNALLRGFVQRAFPSITTSSKWRDMAFALTSRSRAWERRAFIAREIIPPRKHPSVFQAAHPHGPMPGWMPAIDSYENWTDAERKEVLAYSAAGRLMLRIVRRGIPTWNFLATEDDHRARNDILNIKLLRPHQHMNKENEAIVVHRANGDVELVESTNANTEIQKTAIHRFRNQDIDCIGVSHGRDPQLAVCRSSQLCLAPVEATETRGFQFSTFETERSLSYTYKISSAKYLAASTLATSIHYLDGRDKGPIHVFDTGSERTASRALQPTITLSGNHPKLDFSSKSRTSALCLATLDAGQSAGNLLMSGWSDGVVRMHDIRAGTEPVRIYQDTFDDGQIVSILPFGQECFLAGGARNALLKMFDMRMERAPYSCHREKETPEFRRLRPKTSTHLTNTPSTRDMSIFLAVHIPRPRPRGILRPSSHSQTSKLPRYRNSVNNLSSPSPWSSTVYAGIEDRVIQLDFVSTDDIKSNRGEMGQTLRVNDSPILDLSCYERPPALPDGPQPAAQLCKQRDWSVTVGEHRVPEKSGWDERWTFDTLKSWKRN